MASVLALFFIVISYSQHGEHSAKVIKPGDGKVGILLLAHGGKSNWNEEVIKIAATVDKIMPVETAFGMASKRNIQPAVDRLIARGVTEIVAVPLFISSHSSVITSTEYLLGQRKEAPAAVAIFAKMNHGHGSHDTHKTEGKDFDPTTPVKSSALIRMTSALDRHDIVADILASRAGTISQQPDKEVVILVAHGPVADAENDKWLADMAVLAARMGKSSKYTRIEYLTVRDDAPEPIRSKATADLRAVVERAHNEGTRVLIVPLLLSYGGIEKGVINRLEGLEYTMPNQGLLPDERLAEWILESAKASAKK